MCVVVVYVFVVDLWFFGDYVDECYGMVLIELIVFFELGDDGSCFGGVVEFFFGSEVDELVWCEVGFGFDVVEVCLEGYGCFWWVSFC